VLVLILHALPLAGRCLLGAERVFGSAGFREGKPVCAADRTAGILGDVRRQCAGRNSPLGIAYFCVVDPSAEVTYILQMDSLRSIGLLWGMPQKDMVVHRKIR